MNLYVRLYEIMPDTPYFTRLLLFKCTLISFTYLFLRKIDVLYWLIILIVAILQVDSSTATRQK